MFIDYGLISIIIPTFNRRELLKQAIKSVFDQSYENWELIICDDGSTDGTGDDFVNTTDSRIRYLYQQNSGKPAVARNLGIVASRGEFVSFLDSDDLFFPSKLEEQVQMLVDRNLSLVSCGSVTFFSDSYFSDFANQIGKKNGTEGKIVTLKEMVLNNRISTPSVLIRRDVVDTVGFFDETVRQIGEDYEYFLRIVQSFPGKVLSLSKPLFARRIFGDNISTLNNRPIYNDNRLHDLAYIFQIRGLLIYAAAQKRLIKEFYLYNVYGKDRKRLYETFSLIVNLATIKQLTLKERIRCFATLLLSIFNAIE